jgi:hypothetical protein
VERGNSVRKLAATAVLLALVVAVMPAFGDEELVLIVSADSKILQLDSLEVRKLFLGLTVTHDGHRLRPVLNEADARVNEIFLQNVVSMSDITYDRRLLRLALQQGRTQPTAFKDTSLLIQAVGADPNAVSYAWAKDVAHDSRVRIVRVLWQD